MTTFVGLDTKSSLGYFPLLRVKDSVLTITLSPLWGEINDQETRAMNLRKFLHQHRA